MWRPNPHPTIVQRRPVFVPPPPVIELDEIAVVPDLPTVLDTDARETYRRIFQAQASASSPRPMPISRGSRTRP